MFVEGYVITARTGVRYPAAPPCITQPSRLGFALRVGDLSFDIKKQRPARSRCSVFSFFVFEHLFYSSATPIIGGSKRYVNDDFRIV